MSKPGMLRHEPWATSSVDRQHDGRPVEGVDELRGDDADDAAVPAFAGDDEHAARADVGIGLDDLPRLGDDVLLFLPAARVLGRRAARPAPAPRRAIASSEASSSRVAMSGVLMRPAALTRGATMKRDVVAVDRLAGQAGRRRAARAGRPCAAPCDSISRPELGDDAVLADERHDVGQRADGGDLDERRQPARLARRVAQSACTSFSATPTPARCLSG